MFALRRKCGRRPASAIAARLQASGAAPFGTFGGFGACCKLLILWWAQQDSNLRLPPCEDIGIQKLKDLAITDGPGKTHSGTLRNRYWTHVWTQNTVHRKLTRAGMLASGVPPQSTQLSISTPYPSPATVPRRVRRTLHARLEQCPDAGATFSRVAANWTPSIRTTSLAVSQSPICPSCHPNEESSTSRAGRSPAS